MQAALRHEKVIKHVRKGLFGTPLYIIVGVATASKLSVKEQQARENKTAVSANMVAPGGWGEGETGFKHENTAAVNSELDVGESCDFAYRVREFVYSKFQGLRNKGIGARAPCLVKGRVGSLSCIRILRSCRGFFILRMRMFLCGGFRRL